MIGAETPQGAFASYRRELELLESAWRTGAPRGDRRCAFFEMPPAEFATLLEAQRDAIDEASYLGIVAEAEAVLQRDFRARASAKASVPLRCVEDHRGGSGRPHLRLPAALAAPPLACARWVLPGSRSRARRSGLRDESLPQPARGTASRGPELPPMTPTDRND